MKYSFPLFLQEIDYLINNWFPDEFDEHIFKYRTLYRHDETIPGNLTVTTLSVTKRDTRVVYGRRYGSDLILSQPS